MTDLLEEKGFTADEAQGICECLKPVKKSFGKQEVIFGLSESDEDEMGIVLEGTAVLISVNSEGQKSIIDICLRGDIFGRQFFPTSKLGAYYILAKDKCVTAHFKYSRLIGRCEKACEKHLRLTDMLVVNSLKRLQVHIDILSQRSIRMKLIYCFEYFSQLQNSRRITLPFSLTDLADYISADRSAMMREIKKLSEEEIISSKGKNITILRQNI